VGGVSGVGRHSPLQALTRRQRGNCSSKKYHTDADRLLENLRERLAKFGLELHPDKTRRLGRFADENRKRRGEGKPETFDFPGFTQSAGRMHEGDSR
jgi:hypothetical protein